MGREYPSYLEEAFEVIVEWAYFRKQIKKLYEENRLCKVPRDPAYPVYMVTDLGIRDAMDSLFFQIVWKELRVIDWFRWSNYSVKDLHNIKLKQARL